MSLGHACPQSVGRYRMGKRPPIVTTFWLITPWYGGISLPKVSILDNSP